MSELRALLLTDVVDSTRLAERLGDAEVAELWTRHDRLARDLLRLHDGLEIDKADGFLLLFDEVDAAVDYHRVLEKVGIRARAGIHFGPVVLRENPQRDVLRGAKPLEVEGLAKSVAGRVMGLAPRRPDAAHSRGAGRAGPGAEGRLPRALAASRRERARGAVRGRRARDRLRGPPSPGEPDAIAQPTPVTRPANAGVPLRNLGGPRPT